MKTTEEWLKNKLLDYKNNPKETIEDMLINTTDIMQQYNNNPNSKATKGISESCVTHNQLFINEIKKYNLK